MQIEYRTGDVIDGTESVLIHGCNATGAFDSGVAGQIRRRLPFAYLAYRQTYLERGLNVGDVIWAIDVPEGDRPRIVGNAITQEFYGGGNRRYVDYDGIRRVIHEVNRVVCLSQQGDIDIACIGPITAVAMPAIGSGLGGGDWSDISQIIEQESVFYPIVYRL